MIPFANEYLYSQLRTSLENVGKSLWNALREKLVTKTNEVVLEKQRNSQANEKEIMRRNVTEYKQLKVTSDRWAIKQKTDGLKRCGD